MRYQLKIFISVVLLASSLTGVSQISSPNADFITLTKYSGASPVNHPIFVFYSPPGEVVSPILRASRSESTAFTFEWSKFDSLAVAWDFIISEPGVNQSELSNLEEGGYKVRVFDGVSIDATYIAWVFINNLEVNVLSNSSDQLIFGKYFCGKLILDATINLDPFWYYNPVSFERTVYDNDKFFQWTTDNSEFEIKPPDIGLSEKGVFGPPAEDMWIILTATDSTGMTDVDSVFYETVEVEAEFSIELWNTESKFYDPSITLNAEGFNAPLKVEFTNKSLNGYDFEWIFTETSNYYPPDRVIEMTGNVDYKPEYSYKWPDSYYPALVAKSAENCIDTFKLAEAIIVKESFLDVPNVFVPGSEKNSHFKPTSTSIKELHIKIFTRTGKLVYKADVTDLDSWDGWDGKIGNRYAAEGVYYYVIEATGYDEERWNPDNQNDVDEKTEGIYYAGFVYLFIEKGAGKE